MPPEPKYRQIAEDLRQKIESGELGYGTQLPTELELRDQYEASRNTIRDAVKLLTTRGLVETRRGQGTFVVTKITPYVTTLTGEPGKGRDEEGLVYVAAVQGEPRRPATTRPQVEIQEARGAGVGELGIPGEATVVSRHQRRYIEGTPWSLQTSFYPMDLALKGARRLFQVDNIEEGAVEYLRMTLGLKQAGYQDMISVRMPDADETSFFKLPEDGRVAVLEVRRTAYDTEGTPFRLTVSVYPADRNRLAVAVGDVPPDDQTVSNEASNERTQGEAHA
jgi:GntR family transcriptional regulator